jgi:hypothetical protein
MPFNPGDRVVHVHDDECFAAVVVSDDGEVTTVLGPVLVGGDGKPTPATESSTAFRAATTEEIEATDAD